MRTITSALRSALSVPMKLLGTAVHRVRVSSQTAHGARASTQLRKERSHRITSAKTVAQFALKKRRGTATLFQNAN